MVQGYAVPWGFWRDPYILGFLHTTAVMFANSASGSKIAHSDLGAVLEDAFKAMSGMNGGAILQVVSSMATRSQPDFLRGHGDARAVFLYLAGLLRNEGEDPLVIEPRLWSTAIPTASPAPGANRSAAPW